MTNIVWVKPDGTVAVTDIVPGQDIDPKEHADYLLSHPHDPDNKTVNHHFGYKPVAYAHPTPEEHSDFFDAWVWDNGNIRVDIYKAREVTRQRLRRERQPLLAAQDTAYIIAQKNGDENAMEQATKETQRLRDVTKPVDSCADLNSLRNLKVTP